MIRPARAEDLPLLIEIERAAGEPFRDVGMAAIADDDPGTVAELAEFADDGRAWVWAEDGEPVAYVLAEVVDGYAHIAQVSVLPGHARRGLGKALIEHVALWARERGLAGLALTTFADVPWNAPYYARLGFRVLSDLPDGLREIRRVEASRGLDAWPRVAMVRPFPS